jgi:hypothetical protein
MFLSTEISTFDDLIDSRSVIERIAYLEDALDVPEEDRDEDEAEELAALRELAEEGTGVEDWQHGATLINESYFTEYARLYASDIHGSAVDDAAWPFSHIDWDEAADDLRSDYTAIEWRGVTFYVR